MVFTEIWGTLVLDPFHNNLVMAPLMDRKYEQLLSANGDRAFVPGWSELSGTKQTRSTGGGFDSRGAADGEWSGSLTFSDLTASQTIIEVDTRVYTAVKVDDPVGMQQNVPILEFLTTDMGRALAEQVDDDCFTTLDGTTNTTQGAENVAITEQELLDSKEILDVAKVKDDSRYFVGSPEAFSDLLNIERFTNSLYAGALSNIDSSKGKGLVGPILDFTVYRSSNVPVSNNGHKNFMFQKEAAALVMQRDIMVSRREPHDEFASAIRAVVYYGLKIMRTTAIVEILGR